MKKPFGKKMEAYFRLESPVSRDTKDEYAEYPVHKTPNLRDYKVLDHRSFDAQLEPKFREVFLEMS